ncbi:hypothetical protein SEA_KNOCKER_55 [Mycobacterium phage Knocker]|nr:hypothetical protein SEA_KNOCKER_55 [Mycobacterium phage Knocker]
MPITFDKSTLIDAAKDAIRTHDAAAAQWEADKAAYIADHASDMDRRAELRALRDAITAFLKTNRQPTRDDANALRRTVSDDYIRNLYVPHVSEREVEQNVPKPKGWLYRDKADSYRGLIKMLEANTDSTITAAQLKLFGYSDLEMLFRRAALTAPPSVS